jgi:hypothetical protein
MRTILALILVICGLSGLSVLLYRTVSPTETKILREQREQSESYKNGTRTAIANYCKDLDRNPEHAPALADMIRQQAATASPDVLENAFIKQCVAKAQAPVSAEKQ